MSIDLKVEETYKNGVLDKSVFKVLGFSKELERFSKPAQSAKLFSINKDGVYKVYQLSPTHFPTSFVCEEGEVVPTKFKEWRALPSLANILDFIPDGLIDNTDYSGLLPPSEILPASNFILSSKNNEDRVELYFKFESATELESVVSFYNVTHPLPDDKKTELEETVDLWHHFDYKKSLGDFVLGSVQFENDIAVAIKVYKFFRGA